MTRRSSHGLCWVSLVTSVTAAAYATVASAHCARSRARRRHHLAAPVVRRRTAATPGCRGALSGRCLSGRRGLGDVLLAARGAAATSGAGRPLARLADVEPDRLPQLVHR